LTIKIKEEITEKKYAWLQRIVVLSYTGKCSGGVDDLM
jgi:hypothetical protein